jgi:hypothetical protein
MTVMSQDEGPSRLECVSIRIRTKQVIAAVLALSAADVGLWAEFAPRSFYNSFPLAGRHWVSVLGPYNEHLTRDIGGLYLVLLVISVWAGVRPNAETFAMIGAAWLAFSLPHFTYHMFHLDTFGTADKVGNVVTLGGTVILAVLLLLPIGGSAPAHTSCGKQPG